MAAAISFKNARVAWLIGISFAVVAVLYLSSPHISTRISSVLPLSHQNTGSAALSNVKSKYAYVTLLGKDALHNETDINEDNYFASMRTLGWSLLHSKESRSQDIPFIVLTPPGTNPAKRDRLKRDGAIVLEVQPFELPSWLPINQHAEWQDVWCKLRLFELEQFEKILFLDADIVVARPLDPIFEATQVLKSNKQVAIDVDHPESVPEDYVFSAGLETSVNHHFPPLDEELEKGQYINGGVFIVRPGISMLNHYLSVLNTPNSFNPIALEQNLFNQVHRKDGPMPFQQLAWEHNAYRPTKQDVDAGALSYHVKFWNLDHKEITSYINSFRWRAMGFYEAWDEYHQV